MSAGGEQPPGSGSAALPIRPIPRSLARLIVRLRFPIVVAWIAAAVFMTMNLPGLGDAGGGLGGVVPQNSEALRAEQAALQRFSFPLSSRTMVIERDPAGLSKGAQARIVRRDLRATRRHVSPFSHLLGALPVPNTLPLLPFGTEHGTAVLTYLFTSPKLGLTKTTVLAEHLGLTSQGRGTGPGSGGHRHDPRADRAGERHLAQPHLARPRNRTARARRRRAALPGARPPTGLPGSRGGRLPGVGPRGGLGCGTCRT